MILDEVALICLLALAEMVASYGGNMPPKYEARLATCLDVAREAETAEIPVSLAVSVAYEESSFLDGLVSKVGARGPLQIIPRYHCPNAKGEHKPHERAGRLDKCDLVVDGVRALKWFWTTYDKDWPLALAHYSSGEKIYPSSRGYARRVIRRSHRLDDQLNILMALEAVR